MTVLQALRKSFLGDIHLPGDAGYEANRLSWHRTIDPRPAVVAEAADAWDVLSAVDTAGELDLPFAVQATGHGTLTPADGGLLLRTSRLASVEVDPDRRTARVGPGALWSDVVEAAAPYGLAPLSGTAPVGVAGYTLGGGAGWLSRKYGFAADSLLRAEVVTADAEPVTASAEENPDLFWALRGGGPNFGAVTSLEFRLFPVGRLYAGISLYDAGNFERTISYYREWALAEPDDLSTAVLLFPTPERWVLGIRVVYLGSEGDASWLLDPLLDAAGEPLVNGFRTCSFAEMSAAFTPPPAAAPVRQHIDLFDSLPDGLIDVLASCVDSPVTGIEIRHWGGAMGRPSPDAGPVGHRDVPFSVIASSSSSSSSLDDLAGRLRPYATGGTFLNFLTDPARTSTAFTAYNYQRLGEVKRAWDPDNFFHLGHNIPPVRSGSRAAAVALG